MITRNNYEEQFLLYLDNELSQADRLSVEGFVRENPDLLEELEAFRQCRLIPEEETSFGNTAPLLRIAATSPFLLNTRTYRMTRISAASILLLLISLVVFIRMPRPAAAPITAIPPTVRSQSPHIASSPSRPIVPSPARTENTTRPLKKEFPAVTPGPGDALYLATTHRQQDNNLTHQDNQEIPVEEIPDPVPASTRISVPSQVIFIDPGITRAPEKIILAQAPVPGEDATEDLPAEKNKLRGVFRKISRVLEKATAQNDNDRHAILIGNLQIAL